MDILIYYQASDGGRHVPLYAATTYLLFNELVRYFNRP
jgi:hypothetical protein